MEILDLYTDGGCRPNPGIGGWAFILKNNNELLHQDHGCVKAATSSRMELYAVIKGLEYIDAHFKSHRLIRLYSDSKYTVDGINDWLEKWNTKGWITSEGESVLNQDLWFNILELKKLVKVMAIHVHGHSGHPENEYVDRLANISIKEQNDSCIIIEIGN